MEFPTRSVRKRKHLECPVVWTLGRGQYPQWVESGHGWLAATDRCGCGSFMRPPRTLRVWWLCLSSYARYL